MGVLGLAIAALFWLPLAAPLLGVVLGLMTLGFYLQLTDRR